MKATAQIFSAQNIFVFLIFLVLVLTGVLYWESFIELERRWATQDEYSHGYLIPVISLYLIWENRHQFLREEFEGSYSGIFLVLFALFILMAGEVSALYILNHASFIVLLFGLSITIFGRRSKILITPILLLLFAIPLPYFIEIILTAKMQLISSSLGVEMLRLINIPVHLRGNIIDLGDFKLHVVEACSGMRYLFPLASIGFITAMFYRASFWKKALIFASTIPITIFMNSFRIATTGVLVERYGSSIAEGFLHDFEGWVVFVICLCILIIEILVLEYFTTRRPLSALFAPPKSDSDLSSDFFTRFVRLGPTNTMLAGFAGIMVLSVILLVAIDRRKDDVGKQVELANFPLSFEAWKGRFSPLESGVIKGLAFDDYVLIDYRSKTDNKKAVNFYVAYYESQRKGASPHSPKVCMPGGGWEIVKFSREQLNKDMKVNRVVIQKGLNQQLVYYWFVERGEVVANEYYKKWLLFRDAITKNRTDGSLVRVVTPINSNENLQEAEARIQSFIEVAHKELQDHLPGKVE